MWLVSYHGGCLQGEHIGFLLHQLPSSLGNQLDTGTVKNVRLLEQRGCDAWGWGGGGRRERERGGGEREREVRGA